VLTKVSRSFTKVSRSLPSAFMLFSLITKVGGSVESGVGRGDWREIGENGRRIGFCF